MVLVIKYGLFVEFRDGKKADSLHNSEEGARNKIMDQARIATPAVLEWNERPGEGFITVARLIKNGTPMALYGIKKVEVGDV